MAGFRVAALINIFCTPVLVLSLVSCGGHKGTFVLTLAHLNDTHSHLEPVSVKLTIAGERTGVQLGGFPRLKTAIDRMRSDNPELLLLHAGDAVQGTLYFTLFHGDPEFDFLNLLGVDAMTFGNHEFDRGAAAIPNWISRSRFPWLSANIDFTAEPNIAPLVSPYLIKEVRGEKIGIIGVTTETTPQSTRNVGKAVFNDAVASARQEVAALTALGINKIIVLSHLGYERDKALAAAVAGVDIVIGGHSHTLLGDAEKLAAIGLIPAGPYPTEVKGADGKRVLVLQSWQWGDFIGELQVAFTADGEVVNYRGGAVIPMGSSFSRNGSTLSPDSSAYGEVVAALERSGTAHIVADDPIIAARLAPYTDQLEQFRHDTVAVAAEDIPIGLNSGPGPLAADSMLTAVPKAQLAVLNYGGVRKGLTVGPITVGDVLEIMPFANTLVLVDLSGSELKQALEDDIDFLLAKYGAASMAMPYLGNALMTVRPSADKGERITALAIRATTGGYQPLQPLDRYKVVVNAFVAAGGDGFTAIGNAPGFRTDTGIIDSDALRDYLQSLGSVANPTEQRIVIAPTASAVLLPWTGSVGDCQRPPIAERCRNRYAGYPLAGNLTEIVKYGIRNYPLY